jgi:hypothetical protein
MSHDHDDELAVRAAALEALLVEKELLTTDQVDAIVERYERDLGPQNGARGREGLDRPRIPRAPPRRRHGGDP